MDHQRTPDHSHQPDLFPTSTRENRQPVFEPSNAPVSQLSPTADGDGLDRMMAAAAQRLAAVALAGEGTEANGTRWGPGSRPQPADNPASADPRSAPSPLLLHGYQCRDITQKNRSIIIGIQQWLHGRSPHGGPHSIIADRPLNTIHSSSSVGSSHPHSLVDSPPLSEVLARDWCYVADFLDEGELAHVGAWLEASP